MWHITIFSNLLDRDPHSCRRPAEWERNDEHLVLLAVAVHGRPADGGHHLAVPLGVVEKFYLVRQPSMIWGHFVV